MAPLETLKFKTFIQVETTSVSFKANKAKLNLNQSKVKLVE